MTWDVGICLCCSVFVSVALVVFLVVGFLAVVIIVSLLLLFLLLYYCRLCLSWIIWCVFSVWVFVFLFLLSNMICVMFVGYVVTINMTKRSWSYNQDPYRQTSKTYGQNESMFLVVQQTPTLSMIFGFLNFNAVFGLLRKGPKKINLRVTLMAMQKLLSCSTFFGSKKWPSKLDTRVAQNWHQSECKKCTSFSKNLIRPAQRIIFFEKLEDKTEKNWNQSNF